MRQVCDELTLTQDYSKVGPTNGERKNFHSPMSQMSREISFNSSSDLFSATQRTLNVGFKAAAFSSELKNEARAR